MPYGGNENQNYKSLYANNDPVDEVTIGASALADYATELGIEVLRIFGE